ncbi:hypothetical protein KP509_20G087900 [Ceratopteris richardii]|uniref:Hexosyltransferase n=1 Tax=Ceratopteris richardii TaxID=49495 RepID=A0A8T2SHW9_CERRI|nr:hypothetical protein KP509_20G087900 [Ceratopteris richardii]
MSAHCEAVLRSRLGTIVAAFVTLLAAPCFGRPSLITDLQSAIGVVHSEPTTAAVGDLSSFHFKEAPSFRNGKECIASESHFTGFAEQESQVCDMLAVHLAMTLDVAYIRGSVAAILSILQHATCPENVVFHFLASNKEAALAQALKRIFPYLRFRVYHFDENLVKDKISASIRTALEQPLNYARTYLADLLPICVKRVIYLDSDVVVVDDISYLWATQLNGHPLGAPVYCDADFVRYFTNAFWKDAALSAIFEGHNPCYFNTGVMVMDLEMWRFWGYTKAIEDWMEVQKSGARIYELGSLPPFLLVFAGDVQPIEHRWNQHGLGGDNLHGICRTLHRGPVSLMHWSGKGKPWVRLDNGTPCTIDSLWAPYDLLDSRNVILDS